MTEKASSKANKENSRISPKRPLFISMPHESRGILTGLESRSPELVMDCGDSWPVPAALEIAREHPISNGQRASPQSAAAPKHRRRNDLPPFVPALFCARPASREPKRVLSVLALPSGETP